MTLRNSLEVVSAINLDFDRPICEEPSESLENGAEVGRVEEAREVVVEIFSPDRCDIGERRGRPRLVDHWIDPRRSYFDEEFVPVEFGFSIEFMRRTSARRSRGTEQCAWVLWRTGFTIKPPARGSDPFTPQ